MNKNPYEKIAKYYDDTTNREVFLVYKDLIGEVKNKNILDLGCGTGTLLQHYSSNNKTFGLDVSARMIEQARKKDKKSAYLLGDIKHFSIKEKFNIIICAYDTINHLEKLQDWEAVFKNAAKHLHDDGVFIFDFNTRKGLRLSRGTVIQKIKKDYIVRQVELQGSSGKWIFHHFQKTPTGLFSHNKAIIKERAFPQKEIKKLVRKYFKIIDTKNSNGNRIYIKATKKAA